MASRPAAIIALRRDAQQGRRRGGRSSKRHGNE